VSRGLSVVANATEPGLLRVVVYGPSPINDDGLLLNLRFTAVGVPGSVSSISLENMMFNEGSPQTVSANGRVKISNAIPDQAEINGRLLTAMGKNIGNARVTLTDTTGKSRSVVSNGLGAYRFGGLRFGETYTLSVESRHWTFTPITVSATEELVAVDLIAEE